MSEIDLQKFCSTEQSRYYLMKPFSIGDFTYATNGHIALRVPRRADAEEVEKAPKSVVELFASLEGKRDGAVPFPAFRAPQSERCKDCRGTGKVTTCTDCGGEGVQECDLGHDHDCEECDGRGTFSASEGDEGVHACETCDGGGLNPVGGWDVPVIFPDGTAIALRYASRIVSLPNPLVATGNRGEADPVPFWFDGGAGLLMPLRSREWPDAIRIGETVPA